jgi:hypothetical protein
MLRQDQQHPIPQSDGLIDFVENFVTNPQIMRREPAAHPLVLQVGVEAIGKLLIFIAEAGGTVLGGSVADAAHAALEVGVMPKVLNIRTTKGVLAGAVYVGRETISLAY